MHSKARKRPAIFGGALVAMALSLATAACTTTDIPVLAMPVSAAGPMAYAQVQDGGFTVPAVPPGKVDPKYLRQQVRTPSYVASYAPGTIVVDPGNRYLYLTQADGTSVRYGIGVGREGFAWSGDATIKAKREWPRWIPPVEMQARDPEAAKYPNGMDGGLGNPLGARALYLFQGDRDTLYRLHGTNDPSSIGKAVSSGCVRMLNQDIIDLYNRVPIGTQVVVLDPGFKLPPFPDLPPLPQIDIPNIFAGL